MSGMIDVTYLVGAFGVLFAILNPPGNMPLFLVYTKDLDEKVQRATAVLLSVFIFVVMVLSMFFGDDVLRFFGISIPSFQIAGGIIIFLIALSMIGGRHTENTSKVVSTESDLDPFKQAESVLPKILVPLGIPIYCGPGAISTAVLIGNQAPDLITLALAIGVLGVIVVIITLFNVFSDIVSRLLGKQGVEILVRLMGLILAGIGIQLIFLGLGGLTTGVINMAVLRV
jgi:multiple antibiotic resistance protein